MGDSRDGGGEPPKLPTAATVGEHAHVKEGSYQITNSITVPPEIGHLEEGDELIRKKDAIQRQIEMLNQIDEGIREAIEKTDRDVPYFVYNQLKQHKKKLQSQLDTEQKNAEGDATE